MGTPLGELILAQYRGKKTWRSEAEQPRWNFGKIEGDTLRRSFLKR